jgi:Trk K+ transport system NAD-binding subunit
MYIIIVGGGNVGYYLSKSLLSEGHEVLVLEKDPGSCARFEDDLGSICVRGDGCEVATLVEAGASRADVFIAITNEDDDNLVSCQIAKYKFNVPRTIARVNDRKMKRFPRSGRGPAYLRISIDLQTRREAARTSDRSPADSCSIGRNNRSKAA